MGATDKRRRPASPPGHNRSPSPRTRYIALTYAIIALAAVLMVAGQLLLLTLLLLSCMIFAPRIVEIVTQSKGDDILFGPRQKRENHRDAR